MRFLLACVLIFSTTQVLAQSAQRSPTLPSQSDLKAVLASLQEQLDLPSLSATIRTDAGSVSAAVGLADVEQDLPQSTQLYMPGGSTGKSFVAATAMALVEADAIRLDDPISLYVGKRSWYADLFGDAQVTVEHLLTHTSGVPDHVEDLDFAWAFFWRRINGDSMVFRPDELIRFVADNGLQFEPGTDFTYTDTGYLVLGLVLEAATDLTYYELLDRYILTPHDIPALPAISDTMPDISQGYVNTTFLTFVAGISGPAIVEGIMQAHPKTEWTGGGLMTTPEILATFYHKLANGEIVKPATFEQMHTAGLKLPDTPWHYGYGLYVQDDMTGHSGWYPGYTSNARHFANDNVTIAMQSNTDKEYNQWQVIRALLDMVTEPNP